ncbi:DNA damage-regulated autophagy modulator protein 1 [Merluccius polli]|uniref:DNA damage-regulated autophagy modulator protein 1 n=1 Tax=Merluccius polli TaxID=89951 RepID=A0AA47NNQ8_MERPO|nr:DNA damage-regulated autophagy modulator protein 1 [Merluccius polli]
MYVRYKFVQRLNEDLRTVRHTLNACAFGLGMISCVGMCVVATFQETTLTVVHDTGALLFFGTGMFYAILQSAISYKINQYRSSLCMCHTRTAIATITLLAVLDYTFHLVSAVGEWIVAFSFVSFFLTFIPDFKLFALQVKAELVQYS